MDRDELKALVEWAREDETFPGYFLYCQVGISGVRSSFGWVDSDGFLRTRDDLADEYEAELDYTGAAAGLERGALFGAAARAIDPAGFGEGVSIYIARLEAQGVLIPLYYAD
jgi:hypothetical protein